MARIYDSWEENPWRVLPNLSIYMDEQQATQPQAQELESGQIIVTLSNGSTLLGELSVQLNISFHPQEMVSDQNISGLHQYNQGLAQSAQTIGRDLKALFVDALRNRERELARIEPQQNPEAQSVLNIPDPEDTNIRDDLNTAIAETPMQRFVRTNITDNNIGETPAEPATTPNPELAPSE
jgi:hypothetical protein